MMYTGYSIVTPDIVLLYLACPGVAAVRAGRPLGQVGGEVAPGHLGPGLVTEV